MLPKTDWSWEDADAVAADIADSHEDGTWETWVSPLTDLSTPSSWFPEMSYDEWNNVQYQEIQAWGTQREFDDWWQEKMRRKTDGIE